MDTVLLILVINMASEVERWQTITAALQRLDLPFTRVPAIDARRKMGLVRARIPRLYVSAGLGRPLSSAECCCALSHIAALKRVVRSQRPVAVILEDDATFDGRFKDFVTGVLHEFVRHCDIVKCEGLEYVYTSTTGPRLARSQVADLILPLRPSLGAAAYAVTQRNARRLLAMFAALSDPLDHMLVYYERHWIPYSETRPFLVWQAAFPSHVTATIQTIPETPVLPAPVLERLRRSRLARRLVRLGLAAWWVGRARLRAAGGHWYREH